MKRIHQRDLVVRIIGVLAIGFGLLTIKEGGSVLFVDGPARTAAGSYVPFVLWFNFAAGFVYVAAGIGLWLQRDWGLWLPIVIASTTALVFAALGLHVYFGGAYEVRTVVAMSMRTTVWTIFAALVWWRYSRAANQRGSP